MNIPAQFTIDVAMASDAAARQLVSVTHWGRDSYISLPFFYPSGATVTVKISEGRTGLRVSDNGFAFREVESLGAERSFPKTASRAAQDANLEVNRRVFFTDASSAQLIGAIAEVGIVSWQVAHKICDKVSRREEATIADHLHDRLVDIFGIDRVRPEGIHLVGLSSYSWEVSALVQLDGRPVVFDAVANRAPSVYRTSTKFHDLAALDRPPTLIAVVRDKKRLGPKLALLAQAGRVIEENQADDVFLRAAS